MAGTGSQPATPSIRDAAGCGSHLPICDDATFEQLAGILPPDAILTYLRTLSTRGMTLLGEVREQRCATGRVADRIGHGVTIDASEPFPRPEILARQAHNLAGAAGMLGLRRLAFVASRLEQAVERASTDGPDLVASLEALIEDSLVEMRRRMASRQADGTRAREPRVPGL